MKHAKRIFAAALLLMILFSALAENAAGTVYAGDGFTITLPEGVEILDEGTLAGYEAAVESDFPGAGETLLAVMRADCSAAVTISAAKAEMSGPEAANAAAQTLLGGSDMVKEIAFGENDCGSFACMVGELQFNLYYFSAEGRLLVIGTSGLEEAEIEDMLNSLTL